MFHFVLTTIGLILCVLLGALHANGIRLLENANRLQKVLLAAVYILVYFGLVLCAAYDLSALGITKRLATAGAWPAVLWFCWTSWTTKRFLWRTQGLGLREFLGSPLYFCYQNPPAQALLRSWVTLALAILNLGVTLLS